MPKKILIVEDTAEILEMYKTALEAVGFEVDGAMTGDRGLEKINQVDYNLILLDIMLPGINGISVLQRIKQNEAKKKTKVYMLSALDQQNIIDQATQNGADGYFSKSDYTPNMLAEKVKELLSDTVNPI